MHSVRTRCTSKRLPRYAIAVIAIAIAFGTRTPVSDFSDVGSGYEAGTFLSISSTTQVYVGEVNVTAA
jgi:hypothetical protein